MQTIETTKQVCNREYIFGLASFLGLNSIPKRDTKLTTVLTSSSCTDLMQQLPAYVDVIIDSGYLPHITRLQPTKL